MGTCIKLRVPFTLYTSLSFPIHWTFIKLIWLRSCYIILAIYTLMLYFLFLLHAVCPTQSKPIQFCVVDSYWKSEWSYNDWWVATGVKCSIICLEVRADVIVSNSDSKRFVFLKGRIECSCNMVYSLVTIFCIFGGKICRPSPQEHISCYVNTQSSFSKAHTLHNLSYFFKDV
jgi:hypothetical protein